MTGQVHNSLLFTFYVLCFDIVSINSRTSTMWKLNSNESKIVEASPFHRLVTFQSNGYEHFVTEDDPVFNIITSTVHFGHSWVKKGMEYYCRRCNNARKVTKKSNDTLVVYGAHSVPDNEETLDCGKPVNFTYYDNLVGVLNRNRHPNVWERQVSLIFTKSKKTDKGIEFDIESLERRLKKAKKEKPKSVQLYNQIGNFWRIKGDPQKAIECFRRALSVSPHNAEILLNLARVLFTLQYLDDAMFLTRRSLEVQPPEKGAWQQHFTLGEIFRAYGHYQEAALHLRHTLELKPGFEPAQTALKEIEGNPGETIHKYTWYIIAVLGTGVLIVLILIHNKDGTNHNCSEIKHTKHFNKAMAMRSLRGLGITQRNSRSKKLVS